MPILMDIRYKGELYIVTRGPRGVPSLGGESALWRRPSPLVLILLVDPNAEVRLGDEVEVHLSHECFYYDKVGKHMYKHNRYCIEVQRWETYFALMYCIH